MRPPSTHHSTSGDTSTHVATIQNAAKPFDGSNPSDIILRSDDLVDFFVLQPLLGFVSPVFRELFPAIGKNREVKDGLSVVIVTEDSETLLSLLSLIYPLDRQPQVTCAPLFSKVCRAARKYGMDVIERRLRGMLSSVEPSRNPDKGIAHHFLLYAIAIQFGWHSEATKAARHTISTPWRKMPYNDELKNITGADFFGYVSFRNGSKTLPQVKPLPPIVPVAKADIQVPITVSEEPFDSPARADIILRSKDRVDFYVLRNFMSFVTSAFHDVNHTTMKDEMPVIDLEEDCITLRHLLSFIYPCVESQIDDIDNFVKVCQAARKYKMDVVVEKLKHKLNVSRHIVDEPMRALWVAIAFGWGRVAKKAALNALAVPVGNEVPFELGEELWLVSGADVYWFIQYKFACCDAACEAVLEDRLFAPDNTEGKEKVVQRVIDRLKEVPRGSSIKQACATEIQETSNEPSNYQTNLLFKLLKKRDKLVTTVENAISKVPLRLACVEGA